jgi:hypothetical protein
VGEAPDREVLAALLVALQADWGRGEGPKEFVAADVVKRAGERTDLHEALLGVGAEHGGKPDTQRLGRYLRKVSGRVVQGLVIERRGVTSGTARWVVSGSGVATDLAERGGIGGSGGSGRSPSTYVYVRGGPACARARTDLHESPSSPSPPSDPVEEAEQEAIRDEGRGGPRSPMCPICVRTDRPTGNAAGCRVCREFIEATEGREQGWI